MTEVAEVRRSEETVHRSVDDLQWIRIYDFRLIPQELHAQITTTDINMDRVFQFGDGIARDPLTLLYVLADSKNIIKGFLWAEINIFTERVHINALSLAKEYQAGPADCGEFSIFKKAVELIQGLLEGSQLKPEISFATAKPKAFEAFGAKQTKLINMILGLDIQGE